MSYYIGELFDVRARLSMMVVYDRIYSTYGDFSHPAEVMIDDVRKLLAAAPARKVVAGVGASMARLIERMHARETDAGGGLNIGALFHEADAICAACNAPPFVPPANSLIELADRVEALKTSDNAVDVFVEIALFTASPKAVSVRPNAARTKVIYTNADGSQTTHLPWDRTHQQPGKSNRDAHTAAAFRARAADLLKSKECPDE